MKRSVSHGKLKSSEMLTNQRQIRLFGLRYGVVFAGLALATAVLIILLFFSIPPGQDHAAIANAARQVQSGWIRLVVLFSLLGVIATAAAVTVYSYLGTKAKLSRMQTTAKAILESMVGGVLTFDTKGNITIINRAASQILEVCWNFPTLIWKNFPKSTVPWLP